MCKQLYDDIVLSNCDVEFLLSRKLFFFTYGRHRCIVIPFFNVSNTCVLTKKTYNLVAFVWTNSKEEELIEFWKTVPALYDPGLRVYSKQTEVLF